MTATPVDYRPAASYTAGNTLIGLLPAAGITDLNQITVAQANTAIAIQGALSGFEPSSSAATQTRKMIGDREAAESPGTITRTLGNLTIALGDPQAATNEVASLVTEGAKLVILVRSGLQADKDAIEAPEAGQKYTAWSVIVAAVDLGTITTDDGNEDALVAQVSVQRRSALLSTLTA